MFFCVCVSVCFSQQITGKQLRQRPPRLCVRDFVLICPFPETHTNNKLSFLIKTFHSLPCKHPARLAGARTRRSAWPQFRRSKISSRHSKQARAQTHTHKSLLFPFHECPHANVSRPGCAGSQESDSSQTAKKDMLAALRARQEALEETLRQRLEELKSICIREAVRVVNFEKSRIDRHG